MVETSVMSIFVNICWVSTVASASCISVDNNLSINTNWGLSLEVVEDVESISNG